MRCTALFECLADVDVHSLYCLQNTMPFFLSFSFSLPAWRQQLQYIAQLKPSRSSDCYSPVFHSTLQEALLHSASTEIYLKASTPGDLCFRLCIMADTEVLRYKIKTSQPRHHAVLKTRMRLSVSERAFELSIQLLSCHTNKPVD